MAPINIDGSRVQDITINGQPVTEVTVDGDVVFPSGPNTIVDTFEDGNVTEYQTSAGGWTASTNQAFEGNFSGELDQDGSIKIFSSPGDGLNHYPEQGDAVEWYVYHEFIETSTSSAVFGSNGNPNNWTQGYECNVRADGNNSNFSMNLSSREGEFSQTSIGNFLDEWLRGRFEWSSNANLVYELYQTNGSTNRNDHTLIDSVTYDASAESGLSNRSYGYFANNFGSGGRRSLSYFDNVRADKSVV